MKNKIVGSNNNNTPDLQSDLKTLENQITELETYKQKCIENTKLISEANLKLETDYERLKRDFTYLKNHTRSTIDEIKESMEEKESQVLEVSQMYFNLQQMFNELKEINANQSRFIKTQRSKIQLLEKEKLENNNNTNNNQNND